MAALGLDKGEGSTGRMLRQLRPQETPSTRCFCYKPDIRYQPPTTPSIYK